MKEFIKQLLLDLINQRITLGFRDLDNVKEFCRNYNITDLMEELVREGKVRKVIVKNHSFIKTMYFKINCDIFVDDIKVIGKV